jgi:hypothetical protein
LLVTHYGVEGMLHPLAEEATIHRRTLSEMAGTFDCVLSGHLHAGQDLVVAGLPVIFPGPTERLDFGELEVRCGFVDLEVALEREPRLSWEHVALEPQPMRREIVSADELPSERATEWLAARMRAWSDPDQIMQLRLRGALDRSTYQSIDFLGLWRIGSDLNFYFDLDRHLLYIRDDDLAGDAQSGERPSPRSEIDRIARTMQQAADSDEERALLEDARKLALAQYSGAPIEE